jgi:predicted metal-dependent HD superfamily phosphohydrolase
MRARAHLPERCGIVVIGRNEGARLGRALDAAVATGKPVVYVDSRSTDDSVLLAKECGADVVELEATVHLSAAVARNAGADRLLAEHQVDDPDAVRLAALFHDAVYDPRSATNETASAHLAAARLGEIGWTDDRRALVARLIELTAGHEVDPADVAGAVLLDADLAILGADPGDYQHYVNGVRTEYAHVDDEGWRTGRAQVLQHFLAREAIYLTATMHADREQRARANLTAELTGLRG